MTENNIWESFSFSEEKKNRVLDYLSEFKEGLVAQTGGELVLETEAVDAIIDSDPVKPVAVYKLFIVAPKLGNFRRKILTVVEYSDKGRFPVDIVNHFNNDEKLPEITEDQFSRNITKIIVSPIVKSSIENLYQQSKQYGK